MFDILCLFFLCTFNYHDNPMTYFQFMDEETKVNNHDFQIILQEKLKYQSCIEKDQQVFMWKHINDFRLIISQHSLT